MAAAADTNVEKSPTGDLTISQSHEEEGDDDGNKNDCNDIPADEHVEGQNNEEKVMNSPAEFDASVFTSFVLSSEAITTAIKAFMKDGLKVGFFLPLRGIDWSEIPVNIIDNFCFVSSRGKVEGGKEEWVNGGRKMTSLSEEYVEWKDEEHQIDRQIKITLSFIIDSDAILVEVFILEASTSELGIIPLPTSASSSSFKASQSVDSFLVTAADNFWRETLLKKLREPEAIPIVKEIKRVIKYLSQDGVPTISKSQVTQKFYKDLTHLLRKNPKWHDATDEEIEGSIDAIERYIFSKCSVFVYQAVDTDDPVQDRLFMDKAEELLRLSSEVAEVKVNEEEWKMIGEVLAKLSEFDTPDEKLNCFLALIKLCAKHGGNHSHSADALLPLMMKVIIEYHPRSLISDMRYIQRFHNQFHMVGETAYCITNMVAVITMIEKLHGEKVCKSDPIYSLIVASQEDLRKVDPVEASKTPSEINTVTSTLLNTIGFVPRAISSAVADTFRSRAAASKKEEIIPSSKLPSLWELEKLERVEEPTKSLRRKIRAMEYDNQIKTLTLEEINIALEDYRRLLELIL